MTTPEEKINPDISTIDVGRRTLKTITVYPLSAMFQKNFVKNMGSLLTDIFSIKVKDLSDEQVGQKIASIAVTAFDENLVKLIENAVDPKEMHEVGYSSTEELLDDLSTKQLEQFGEIIYKNNYESLVGKITGFLRKRAEEGRKSQLEILEKASATKGASPSSVDTTGDTGSKTS